VGVGYDRIYYLKKAFALWPGVVRPVSGTFLAAHYRRRGATRGAARAALDAVAGLAFLVWIPWRARNVARRFGLNDDWRRRAIRIARARFADPQDLALFGVETAEAMDGYIRRFEDAGLNRILNPLGWSGACALADKVVFAARCANAALPQPETVALAGGGRINVLTDPAGRELVTKPTDGEGGDGVRRLGAFSNAADLIARAPSALARGPGMHLIQPWLVPHPGLVDLALDALTTVRVVTILDETGTPETVSATFRCASGHGVVVDNMKAGGLIAPVELKSGRLGEAWKGYGGGPCVRHPATGAEIAGRTLPDWPAAVALAERAHAVAFADYTLVGWDIGLTEDGPVLIEGNSKPGVLMPQRAARRGLGEGRYGALIAHHLATKA
jgi:hypothetical protein